MHATQFEFRYRFPIIVLLHVIGLVAPWHWLVAEPVSGETWGLLIALLNRAHLMSFNSSFVLVNALVLASAWAGGLLRWWATAHLGAGTMGSQTMLGGVIVVDGPYRYLRNPLYVGTWLLAFPIVILMQPTGAAFLTITLTLFLVRLVGAEESFLNQEPGETYREYAQKSGRKAPQIVADVVTSMPPAPAHLRSGWPAAAIAESYGVWLAATFSIFCWSFNAQLLLRCAIISFGLSLVLNALFAPSRKQVMQ